MHAIVEFQDDMFETVENEEVDVRLVVTGEVCDPISIAVVAESVMPPLNAGKQ